MVEQRHSIEIRRPVWRETLKRLQEEPLALCPSFPELAARWNAWWRFEADRPLIVAAEPLTPDIRWDKAFDLLDNPGAWLRVRRRQVEETHYAGEALPFVRADIGPVALAAFLGAPLHLALEEQTSWQTPILDTWEAPLSLQIDPDNPWLNTVLTLMETLAEDGRGRYLVCLPDLTGAIDALANLRKPERLCMDLIDRRAAVAAAAARIVDAWESVFRRMYDLVLGHGTGITQWVSAWADNAFTVPTCDFNALIGPADFNELCLPSLADQARRAGLCVFHLDGPEAARHAPALAEARDITAIQYTPGAGTPSALKMLPMFHLLQERRVPLFIETPPSEARELALVLDPRGTALRVAGLTPAEADALVAWRDGTFSRGRS